MIHMLNNIVRIKQNIKVASSYADICYMGSQKIKGENGMLFSTGYIQEVWYDMTFHGDGLHFTKHLYIQRCLFKVIGQKSLNIHIHIK